MGIVGHVELMGCTELKVLMGFVELKGHKGHHELLAHKGHKVRSELCGGTRNSGGNWIIFNCNCVNTFIHYQSCTCS